MNSETEIKTWNEETRELTVSTEEGKTEVLIMKKLGLVGIEKLAKCKQNIDRALLYVAGDRKKEWFESLTPESQMDIIDVGGDINDPLLLRFVQRRKKQMKALGVDLQALVDQEIAKKIERAETEDQGHPIATVGA